VKPNSLTGTQIKESTIKGVKSAAALNNVTYQAVTVTLPANGAIVTSTATCPTGLKVLGGGATVSDSNVSFINDMGPTGDHTGYVAKGFPGPTSTSMTVTAICTAASSTTP
jgi:hypothetical protein